jgi:hypothetical protein
MGRGNGVGVGKGELVGVDGTSVGIGEGVSVGGTDVAVGGTGVSVGVAVGWIFPQPTSRVKTIVTVVIRRTCCPWTTRPMWRVNIFFSFTILILDGQTVVLG